MHFKVIHAHLWLHCTVQHFTSLQFISTVINNISLHNGVLYTALYLTALHCTTLHCDATSLHCTAPYYITHYFTVIDTLHSIAVHYRPQQCTIIVYSILLRCTTRRCIALHCTQCTAQYCTASHSTAVYSTLLHCTSSPEKDHTYVNYTVLFRSLAGVSLVTVRLSASSQWKQNPRIEHLWTCCALYDQFCN